MPALPFLCRSHSRSHSLCLFVRTLIGGTPTEGWPWQAQRESEKDMTKTNKWNECVCCFWCGCHCFYLFMFALKWFVDSTLYLFRLKQITCYKTARERLLLSLLYCISHPSLYDFSMKIGNERMWMELCISLYDDVVGQTLLHRCGYGLSAHSHTRILAINASIQLYTTI